MDRLRVKAAIVGGACLIYVLFSASSLVRKASWQDAPAELIALGSECDIKANDGFIAFGQADIVSIPCRSVEAFKARNASMDWSVNERFTGTLRVEIGGRAVRATLALDEARARTARIGDRFVVLQDPQDAANVELAGQVTGALAMVFGAVVAGALCLLFAFRPQPRMKAPSRASHGQGMDPDEARAADALIAKALARHESTAESLRAARSGSADTSRTPLARASGQRQMFGRRRA